MKASLKKSLQLLSVTSIVGLSVFGMPFGHIGSNEIGAHAQTAGQTQQERQSRRVPAMREPTFRRLEVAQLELDADNYQGALEALQELASMRGLNAYEIAMMHNFYGLVYYGMDDIDRAIASYERVLQQSDSISVAFEDSIRYQIAQLYFADEQYPKALEALNSWFRYQESPTAQAYIFKGQLFYVMERYDEALEPILTAIELTRASGGELQENWFLLLRTIYFEQNNYPKVREVLEYLIINHPKPVYWLQLASVYSELREEGKQLAAMEVAYGQDVFDKESYFVNLAQLYLYNAAPIKAARVLEQAMADDKIEESEENLELLGNSLINSREYDRAVAPMARAAELSETGELSVRLAMIHMQRDNWADAIAATRQGIRKGDLEREDQAYMTLGTSYYNNDQLPEAREAFVEARKDSRSRAAASQWIGFIDREINRRRVLAQAAREND